MPAARLLLSDDHPAILEAVCLALADDPVVEVVGQALTPAETLEAEERLRPDALVLDLLYAHEVQGLDLVRALHDRRPALRILVFSACDERIYAEPALRAGAAGYVMKDAPLATLRAALHGVVGGDVHASDVVARSFLRSLVHGGTGDQTAAALRHLTAQERAVLKLIGMGFGTDALAERLGITRKTAQTHRRRVQQKLGFSHAEEVVHFATLLEAGVPALPG